MCGIVGFLDRDISSQIKIKSISNMLDHIQHRGPDESKYSYHTKSNLILGHRRLSILDLMETGSQPMVSSCGEYEIVFNGEIYNYIELKRFLIKKIKILNLKAPQILKFCLNIYLFLASMRLLEKQKGCLLYVFTQNQKI